MQNIIKTLTSGFKVFVDKKIHNSVADWNQNDTEADNYVKNRTHWEEEKIITEVIQDELSVDFTNCRVNDWETSSIENYIYESDSSNTLEAGKTYNVIYDGQEYTLKAFIDNKYRNVVLGNGALVSSINDDNGLPFAIGCYGVGENIGYILSITQEMHSFYVSLTEAKTIIHKIDNKWLALPSNLATTDDVQKAVDAAEIAQTIADGKMNATDPIGTGSFSMNRKANTEVGLYSHAEGCMATASGLGSHAEGYNENNLFSIIASGIGSHAEGCPSAAQISNGRTIASGDGSHAEGASTVAKGPASHAEGASTVANGDYSHAEGWNTTASGFGSHAQGRNNIIDEECIYAHIVGNGDGGDPSNAHTLDWSGNAWYSGDVYVGSTSGTNKDEGSKKLATEEYVTQKIAEINVEIPTEYDAIILKSSTSGSTKKFRLTIGDDGVLSAEEITL